MSERAKIAQRALISICTRLAFVTVATRDDELLVQRLGELLPDCYVCTAPVAPVRSAAERLVHASTARSRSLAELALYRAVVDYHALAANALIDEWLKGRGKA
ncbi:hypothetical protein VWZ88_01225 [Phaeobacter sp. JH20_36]|uniref:hypothetical protein n=1 Tax=unclassified Phaeobacter TaxID=2621772 RepID=UPI003A888785